MTPDAQRIAIAEACGWSFQEGTPIRFGGTNIPKGWKRKDGKLFAKPPDYLSDLNAMHIAEEAITPMQTLEYERQLAQQIYLADKDEYWKNRGKDIRAHCFHATAAQRAEAFLRTLNLWNTTP